MESTPDASSYLIEKSKKMKKESDDILELVYQQLLDGGESGGTAEASDAGTVVAPEPSPAPEPAPAPSPEPVHAQKIVHTATKIPVPTPSAGSDETPWEGRHKAAAVLDFILSYMLAKKYGMESPTITASIEDTINFQKFMMSIENDLMDIIKYLEENWDFFKNVDIEVDWEKNTITIKPKK